ncbi:hypothetical protein M0802_012783 [Mischocyttarus mexicanus]|nr:hypothetical protein M0802_012783 [Mischocyttarus mexicanus]
MKKIGLDIIQNYKTRNHGKVPDLILRTVEEDVRKQFLRGLRKDIEIGVPSGLTLKQTLDSAVELERSLGLQPSERRRQFESVLDVRCQLCHQLGQTADKCGKSAPVNYRRNSSLETEILICQLCQRRGHDASRCRTRYNSQRVSVVADSPVVSQICNRIGHIARDCRQRRDNSM